MLKKIQANEKIEVKSCLKLSQPPPSSQILMILFYHIFSVTGKLIYI